MAVTAAFNWFSISLMFRARRDQPLAPRGDQTSVNCRPTAVGRYRVSRLLLPGTFSIKPAAHSLRNCIEYWQCRRDC